MTDHNKEPRGSSGEVRAREETRMRGGTRDLPSASLSADAAFNLLSSSRRRDLIRCLDEVGERVDLRDLSERVAATENDITTTALSYDQRKRVYVSLRQTHLPKLSNAGAIDYDPDRSVITPRDGVRALRLLLDTVESAIDG